MRCILCTYIEMTPIKKGSIDKSTSTKNIFYFELSSKNNVDIDGVTVSMWENHEF